MTLAIPLNRRLRDLHSFPTRRSSDLRLLLGDQPRGRLHDPVRHRRARRPRRRRAPPDRVGGAARSEEHTSELQSRRDLVCRLLLEKKKKYNWEGVNPDGYYLVKLEPL